MAKHVLIIDDSEDDRYMLKRQLREIGEFQEIFEVDDGQAALDFLCRSGQLPPDIIFLDINMPGMGGHLFLEKFSEIRELHDLASSVFIMFSSSSNSEDRKKAFIYTFVKGFVVKMPETARDLQKIISESLLSAAAKTI